MAAGSSRAWLLHGMTGVGAREGWFLVVEDYVVVVAVFSELPALEQQDGVPEVSREAPFFDEVIRGFRCGFCRCRWSRRAITVHTCEEDSSFYRHGPQINRSVACTDKVTRGVQGKGI